MRTAWQEYPTLPILVSYPRSGVHWIQAMMEIYFDRPRGPRQNGGITWRPKRDDEQFMWIHTHDRGQLVPLSRKCLFLLRDPVACIYSFMSVDGHSINETTVTKECREFRLLFEKWVVDNKIEDLIRYEDFVRDPLQSLSDVSRHHGIPFDEDRANTAISTCTKQAIIDKAGGQAETLSRFHSPALLKQEYQDQRGVFRAQWSDLIKQLVLTPETAPWLEGYFTNGA